MARYVKKPIPVEAVRVCDIPKMERYPDWLSTALRDGDIKLFSSDLYHNKIFSGVVLSIEGNMNFGPWDYIIQGVDGELYPCKGEIFEKTYERVD